MTIMQSLHFVFDEVRSRDLGIVNVHVSSSDMYSETLTGKRSITEVKSRNRTKPFFLNVDYEPIDFTISMAFLNGFSDDDIRRVGRIFVSDQYKELFFEENPFKRFFVIAIDTPTLSHNGLGQGYLTIHFRNIDSFAYSPVYTSKVYDFSQTNSGTILLENNGDWIVKPEIWITKVGNGDFSIVNTTDEGRPFTFSGLLDGETVYVDNEHEFIQSSLSNVYRYLNFNNEYIKLPVGINTLQVTGNATFQFRYQYKLFM